MTGSVWAQVRRYAVPRWMIERATERRLAGDWRGACAAANIDVTFDLDDVARTHGATTATSLERDLRGFAPDLARWHLPRWTGDRNRRTTLALVARPVLLADYAAAETPTHTTSRLHGTTAGPPDGDERRSAPTKRDLDDPWDTLSHSPPDGSDWTSRPVLHLVHDFRSGLPWGPTAPQRLALVLAPVEELGLNEDWRESRHLWHADHVHELLHRCGGDSRPPFLDFEGRPLDADELPPPHADHVARLGPKYPAKYTECVTLLYERGEIATALAAVGIELKADISPGAAPIGRQTPIALTRLVPEARAIMARTGKDRVRIGTFFLAQRENQFVLEAAAGSRGSPRPPGMPEACWRLLPDLGLLRSGHLRPDELHPLVHAALFPRRTVDAVGPPEPVPPGPVRIRCQGHWHVVQPRGGRLDIPHTAAQIQREHVLQALGGPLAGCFAAQRAWPCGPGQLPPELEAQRLGVFLHAQHGDTPGILYLLDSGLDPHIRDTEKNTLLHWLPCLDHEALLPRLLATGPDVNTRNACHQTPLATALSAPQDRGLVSALRAAGAHTR